MAPNVYSVRGMLLLAVLSGCAIQDVVSAGNTDAANEKPPPSTCNSTKWQDVNIPVPDPSVDEVLGGPDGSICESYATFVIVEEVVWRCEKRYCCHQNCDCENLLVSEEPCMVTPPQLVPVELICLVQHKHAPRFYRRVCCDGYEDIDKICYPKIDCDVNGGGCDQGCVTYVDSSRCTCGPGYELKDRTKCVAASTTTSTTSMPSTTTSSPSTSSTRSTSTTSMTTTTTPTPSTEPTSTTTIMPTAAETDVETTTSSEHPSSTTTDKVPFHGNTLESKQGVLIPLWVLILLPLIALIVFLSCLTWCFVCRKLKPLHAKNDDRPAISYSNETYARAGAPGNIPIPVKPTKQKAHLVNELEAIVHGRRGESVKIIENDLYENEKPPIHGRGPVVVYENHISGKDKMADEAYLMAASVYSSGLPSPPPPYKREDPYYQVIEEGAVGGSLPFKEPLQGYRTAAIENSLNQNKENIYSEIN